MLDELPKDKFIGYLQQPSSDIPAASTVAASAPTEAVPSPNEPQTTADPPTPNGDYSIPPLETIISAPDFAAVASKALTPKAWAFYSSAATDLVTHTNNRELVRRIMFRPRVLKNVKEVRFDRTILGFKSKAPFFASPTAMARLAHPDGEVAMSRAAANEGIFQCVSLATTTIPWTRSARSLLISLADL